MISRGPCQPQSVCDAVMCHLSLCPKLSGPREHNVQIITAPIHLHYPQPRSQEPT